MEKSVSKYKVKESNINKLKEYLSKCKDESVNDVVLGNKLK